MANQALLGSDVAVSSSFGRIFNSSFFGQGRQVTDSPSQVGAMAIWMPQQPPTPPPPQIEDFGGAKDTMLYALTSGANQENRWGPCIRIYGKKVKVRPLIAAHAVPTFLGLQQFLLGVLELGPGPLKVENPQISDRPLTDYPTVSFQYQYGKSDDQPLTYYTNDTENTNPNVDIVNSNTFTTRLAPQVASRLGVNIAFPNGLYKRNSTTGALESAKVKFRVIAYNKNTQTYEYDQYVEANAAQTAPYFFPLEFSVPEGRYDVSINRYDSPAGDGVFLVNNCTWTDLVASTNKPAFYDIKNAQGTLVRMCRVAYRGQASADLNGSLGEISFEATSLLPVWDGTTWSDPVECNNPAWIIASILTEPANYDPFTYADLDLPAFKAFADWCDEKKFTYNKIVDGSKDVYTLCNEVATVGRAVFYNNNGKLSILIDKPVDVISQHFTDRNIIKGSLSKKVSYIQPPDYIGASFLNPNVDGQQDVRNVYDDGKVEGVDFKNETMFWEGVDNADQVYKLTRYIMAQNKLRTAVYQFSAPIEHLTCDLGSRIKLRSERLGLGSGQARITSVNTDGSGNVTGINFDAPQVLALDVQEPVRIRLADNTSIERLAQGFDGRTKTVTFTEAIPHDADRLPAKGDLVIFGNAADLLITGIDVQLDMTAVIYAVDYAPQIYEADAGVVPPFTSQITRPRRLNRTVPTPTIISAKSDETVLRKAGDGSFITVVLLTVAPMGPTVDRLEVQIRLSGTENWSPSTFYGASGGSIEVTGVEDKQTYDIQIRARSGAYFGEWASVNAHYVVGKSTKPPDVLYLVREPAPNQSKIRIPVYDAPRDLRGYNWRAAEGENRNWDQATLIKQYGDMTLDIGGFAAGLKTILVKPVDVAGNESANAASIVVDFGDAEISNVIFEQAYEPSWTGVTITNGSIVGNEIHQDDDGALWFSEDLSGPWFDGLPTDDWFNPTFLPMTVEWAFTPSPSEPKPYKVLVTQELLSMGWKLEYAVPVYSLWWGDNPQTSDEPWFSNDLSEPWWGNDPPLVYSLMPSNGLPGEASTYNFRLTTFGGSYQSVLKQLSTILDVKDITVYINDFIVDNTAGKKLNLADYGITWRKTENIQITLEQDLVNYPDADQARYFNKEDPTGPIIKVFDAARAGATGKVDITLKGY